MRRSKAFVLSEVLMTILLQAGLILVLCMSFYLFLDFYTRTQQILTARNHAERVIQFMDDKIRNAGLGLWRCENPEDIRDNFGYIPMLYENGRPSRAYCLPVSITWNDGIMDGKLTDVPLKSVSQKEGDVLTLLYAQRDLSSNSSDGKNKEIIMTTSQAAKFTANAWDNTKLTANIKPVDFTKANMDHIRLKSLFDFDGSDTTIEKYAVMEALGLPLYLSDLSGSNITVRISSTSDISSKTITIPAASELMYLKCMQMFVHLHDGRRQFAFRELKSSGAAWNDTYNQEIGILDIYMKLDTTTNIFTLYVLASGGDNPSGDTKRPEAWPNKANPRPDGKDDDDEITDEEAAKAWDSSEYCNHVVYVARKSWKLNNIPEGFSWN